jgi:hypothetical protein
VTTYAFVGSRTFNEPAIIRRSIEKLRSTHPNLVIVTGDARGADRMSYDIARVLDVPREMKHADKSLGVPGLFFRNGEIVKAADAGLMAFFAPGKLSHGTTDTVQRAFRKGLRVHAYQDGRWLTEDELKTRIVEEVRDDD